MEIAHVVSRYLPAVSGEAVALHSIAKKTVEKGHDVRVYTTDAIDATALYSNVGERIDRKFDIIDGVKVYRFPVNFKFLYKFKLLVDKDRFLNNTDEIKKYIQSLKVDGFINNIKNRLFLSNFSKYFVPRVPISNKLANALIKDNADIFHVHGISTSCAVYGYVASKKNKKPLAVKFAFHPADKLYYSSLTFRILRESDIIFANTTADIWLLAHFKVHKDRIVVTGDGIDLSRYLKSDKKEVNKFRDKHSLNDYDSSILFLGRLQREKGVFNVINATIQLNKENGKNVKLLIAGPPYGNSQDIIQRLQQKYSFIEYLGTISEDEKIIALHTCDMLVVPSIVESFGIIYIEAWACRKPVIGADIPSTRALISYGEDGFYVRFGNVNELIDKIRYLLENDSEREILGKNGFKKVVEKYTEDKVFEIVYSKYEEILKR